MGNLDEKLIEVAEEPVRMGEFSNIHEPPGEYAAAKIEGLSHVHNVRSEGRRRNGSWALWENGRRRAAAVREARLGGSPTASQGPAAGRAPSVQVALPVRGHPSCRSRDGLAERTVLGRREHRPFVVFLRGVVPKPVLAGFEGTDKRMAGAGRVCARMLGWRGVTASDVAALGAPAQMEPPPALVLALCTARTAGPRGRIDSWGKAHLMGSFAWSMPETDASPAG